MPRFYMDSENLYSSSPACEEPLYQLNHLTNPEGEQFIDNHQHHKHAYTLEWSLWSQNLQRGSESRFRGILCPSLMRTLVPASYLWTHWESKNWGSNVFRVGLEGTVKSRGCGFVCAHTCVVAHALYVKAGGRYQVSYLIYHTVVISGA